MQYVTCDHSDCSSAKVTLMHNICVAIGLSFSVLIWINPDSKRMWPWRYCVVVVSFIRPEIMTCRHVIAMRVSNNRSDLYMFHDIWRWNAYVSTAWTEVGKKKAIIKGYRTDQFEMNKSIQYHMIQLNVAKVIKSWTNIFFKNNFFLAKCNEVFNLSISSKWKIATRANHEPAADWNITHVETLA